MYIFTIKSDGYIKIYRERIKERKNTKKNIKQRTNGPVNAHGISWPSKAQNIQNLEKYMVKK